MAQMISEALLEKYGGRSVTYDRDEVIFDQGAAATHFHSVRTGKVKMSAFNDQGRELLMGYFTDGQSFGEPPFFTHVPYPASAIAVVESAVWKISYDGFLTLLRENFDVHLELTTVLCGRLVYKSMMMTEIAVQEAEHRLATLIEHFRREAGVADGEPYRVPFTRQQLADMTGLRVETVIRCIKSMENEGALRIEEGKIIWSSSNQQRYREEQW
jgi:CRP-like cAMP-binding protein